MDHDRDDMADDTPRKKIRVESPDAPQSPPSPRVDAPSWATPPTHYRVNRFFSRDNPTSNCRTLFELHLLQSVGAVLDKPQWWLKWQNRADVRTKWLGEIERVFVERTLTSIFKYWPQAHDRDVLYASVRAAVSAETADERASLLADATARVKYKTNWVSQWQFREGHTPDEDKAAAYFDAGEDSLYAKALEHLKARGVVAESTKLNKLNPYGQFGWYMHQWSRIQRLRAVGEALTLEDVDVIFGRDVDLIQDQAREYEDEEGGDVQDKTELVQADQRDARDAADVIFALRNDGPLSIETLRTAIGNAEESRDSVLQSLLQYVVMIHVELDALREFVTASVEQILHRCRLRLSDLEKGRNANGITWGPVEETFLSDGLISQELKDQFIRQVRALEDVPADQLDWHPRANDQVLDLVHPSLYCGISGVTKHIPRTADDASPVEDLTKNLLSLLVRSETDGDTLYCRETKFQWLPSDFEISETGDTCAIRSYINNLHPQDHADLYKSIGAIFARFVPLFEGVLGSLKGPVMNQIIDEGDTERSRESELPERLPIPTHDVQLNRPTVPRLSLSGQKLQVIVKIAEIILTPEKPTYDGGSWHIEGTATERIVATGIYYFTSDNVTDSKLGFRTTVYEPQYAQNDNLGVGVNYGLANHRALVQTLGAVTTLEDRCLVFPNTLQHQVQPFELLDKNKRGVRKILCFFLVDPSHRIPSTADIAPQQREWIERARQHELSTTGIPETVQKQILDLAHAPGLTLEQAKAYRLELMDERSPADLFNDEEMFFSLCEH